MAPTFRLAKAYHDLVTSGDATQGKYATESADRSSDLLHPALLGPTCPRNRGAERVSWMESRFHCVEAFFLTCWFYTARMFEFWAEEVGANGDRGIIPRARISQWQKKI
jgi:hypothetical protein